MRLSAAHYQSGLSREIPARNQLAFWSMKSELGAVSQRVA